MGKKTVGVAILAAGEGKRLKVECPKALLPLLGRRLIDFPIEECLEFAKELNLDLSLGVVVGHLKEQVTGYLGERYKHLKRPLAFSHQLRPMGTADALRAYFEGTPGARETEFTMVLCADVPLVRQEDFKKLWDVLEKGNSLNGVAATFMVNDPKGYGRIVRSSSQGFHIVEEKQVDEQTSRIKEVNASLYILRTAFVLEFLDKITLNKAANEFYLTDLFGEGRRVEALNFGFSDRFLGINTLKQWEEVAQILREEKISQLRENGVRLMDSRSLSIDWDVTVEPNGVIYPQVCLEGRVTIGKNVLIESGAIIKNSHLEEGVIIKAYSYLEEAQVRRSAVIGPFAHLRPGSDVGERAKIGNFVEIKKSRLEKGVKVSHLSYVGDADIGEESNIGCGFITCNYDGVAKHKTVIGKNSFIGSDCQVVAPLEIGDNAFVGAGSTITQSIPKDSFAVARSRQVTKEGMAKRFLKKKNSL